MTQLTFETHLRGQKLTLETEIFTRSQTVPGEWSAENFFFKFFFLPTFFSIFVTFCQFSGTFSAAPDWTPIFFFILGVNGGDCAKKLRKKHFSNSPPPVNTLCYMDKRIFVHRIIHERVR